MHSLLFFSRNKLPDRAVIRSSAKLSRNVRLFRLTEGRKAAHHNHPEYRQDIGRLKSRVQR
jgi:hypothetical protein